MKLGITPNFTVNSKKQSANKQNPQFGSYFAFAQTKEVTGQLRKLRSTPDARKFITELVDILAEFKATKNFSLKFNRIGIKSIEFDARKDRVLNISTDRGFRHSIFMGGSREEILYGLKELELKEHRTLSNSSFDEMLDDLYSHESIK